MTDWTALDYKEISERNLFNCVTLGTHHQILCLVTTDKHHSQKTVDRTRRIMDTCEMYSSVNQLRCGMLLILYSHRQ